MAEVVLLNIAQQLFLVLFSILYGVMLQSMSGLHPFPLGRIRKGYMNRKGKVDSSSDKWLIRMWRKRVLLSIILLNVFPIGYLWAILGLLGNPALTELLSRFVLPCENLNLSLHQLFLIGMIFWSALGVFGFYRMYHVMAIRYWETLFLDVELEDRPLSFDAWAHFLYGVLPYLLPPFHYLLLFNFRPALLGMWGVYPVLFLVWLIYISDC